MENNYLMNLSGDLSQFNEDVLDNVNDIDISQFKNVDCNELIVNLFNAVTQSNESQMQWDDATVANVYNPPQSMIVELKNKNQPDPIVVMAECVAEEIELEVIPSPEYSPVKKRATKTRKTKLQKTGELKKNEKDGKKKEEELHVCNIENCHKVFTRLSNLKLHQRIHSVEKQIPCDHCKLSFIRHTDLNMHRRKFSKEFLAKCIKCDLGFMIEEECNAHQEKCEEQGWFHCTQCTTFSTLQKSHLKRHSYIHMDESKKPIACTVEGCKRRFTQNLELESHLKSHRNNKLRKK